MKAFWKLLAMMLTIVIILVGFSGCSTNTQNLLEEIQESGSLIMYTNATFPPYEFLEENNEIVGVDVEIGRAIANQLNVSLEVNDANFDELIDAIVDGKGDIAIAAIGITEERAERVDFSEPYVQSVQYLVIPNDSDIQVVEDLGGKTVGAQAGTMGYRYLEDQNNSGLLKGHACKLNPYQTPTDMMTALNEGKLDAVVVDELVAQQLVDSQVGFQAMALYTADGRRAEEAYAVVIPKGNDNLMGEINQVIEQMKAGGLINQYIAEYSDTVGIED